MSRKTRNTLVLLALAGLAEILRAQEEEYFEEPAKPKLTFRWDALARYDKITKLNRADVERGRFEFRPELALEFSDRFKVGVRGIGTLSTDENVENGVDLNALNFDNYRSNGASIERYYVEARPGSWTLRAGSFGMPLAATEMMWDRDIQTPGAAVSFTTRAGDGALSFSGAGFYGPQREGDRTRIGVGQVLWTRDAQPFAWEVAAGYWHFELDELKAHYIRQNNVVIRDGVREYASDFRILDLLARLRWTAGAIPVQVSADVSRNFGAVTDEKDAFEGSLAVGQLGTPGQWRTFYTFQYVERDAVVGAYNTDDWWFHSWYRGHRVGVGFTVLPRVFVQGAVMFQRRLDLPRWLNRYTVDLVKMF
ncbi:MAG: putative porin [Thermoanaerobaculia bacterium]